MNRKIKISFLLSIKKKSKFFKSLIYPSTVVSLLLLSACDFINNARNDNSFSFSDLIPVEIGTSFDQTVEILGDPAMLVTEEVDLAENETAAVWVFPSDLTFPPTLGMTFKDEIIINQQLLSRPNDEALYSDFSVVSNPISELEAYELFGTPMNIIVEKENITVQWSLNKNGFRDSFFITFVDGISTSIDEWLVGYTYTNLCLKIE